MNYYDHLAQATQDLNEKGYTENFKLENNFIVSTSQNLILKAKDIQVEEMHRFEGNTNPADSSILYALHAPEFDLRGLLICPYGAYADPKNAGILKKLDQVSS